MDAKRVDGFRGFFSRNCPPICFLVAYFVLIVLGNLIYASPYGRRAIAISGYPESILQLNHIFSFGYWVLLFMPFVVTPLVVVAVKKTLASYVDAFSRNFPELTKKWYLIIFTLACAYVLVSFYRHGVAELFLSGKDSVSSVVARFEIRDRLHFTVFMVMQAIVPYLSYVAIINSSKKGGGFWLAAASVSVLMASLFFIMINMKWPVVLYYAGAVLAIFLHTDRYAYTKAVVGGVFVVAAYLLISTVVFRLAPEPTETVTSGPVAPLEISKSTPLGDEKSKGFIGKSNDKIVAAEPSEVKITAAAERAAEVSEAAVGAAPMLMMHLLSRMSILVPYYYQEFTDHPSACGGILVQAQPGPKCRPSTYIYKKLFFATNDQFLGQGTSPAAVHITGYAVGGWTIAVFALVCASIILGMLSCIPLNASSTVSAFGVVGALAGYHFSQIPGEGVLFYEHGLFWTFLLMAGYACAMRLFGGRAKTA